MLARWAFARIGSFRTRCLRGRSTSRLKRTIPASSFIHVACECGLEDCARVLAITRSVYERVRSDPRQFVILPSHLITDVEDVVEESDTFLIVAKRGGTPEDITVCTDPRR
jgi:hypothetical protein